MSLKAAQRERVLHLYRHGLKNLLSWAIRRDLFAQEVSISSLDSCLLALVLFQVTTLIGLVRYPQAARLRAEFDLNKDVVRAFSWPGKRKFCVYLRRMLLQFLTRLRSLCIHVLLI